MTVVKVVSRYGNLSRGKHWARMGSGGDVVWASKAGGCLVLTPGEWSVGSDDGFKRKDRGTVVVDEAGCVTGLPSGWNVRQV